MREIYWQKGASASKSEFCRAASFARHPKTAFVKVIPSINIK